MKKSEIELLIAGRADGADNPVSTERDLWQAILDSGYTKANDDSTAQTYTTAGNASKMTYKIQLSKSLGFGKIIGTFKYISDSNVNFTLFTFKSNEFTPAIETYSDSSPVIREFTAYDASYSSTLRCQLLNLSGTMGMKILGTVPPLSAAEWKFEEQFNIAD